MKQIALSGIVVMMLAIAASAQDTIVQWSGRGPAQSLRPGESFTLDLVARIRDGWHIYSLTQPPGGPVRTVVSIPDKQVFRLAGSVTGPKPHIAYDPNFEINAETYEESVRFRVPLTIDASAQRGSAKIALDVTFQACNENICMPKKTVRVAAPADITATGEKTAGQDRTASSMPIASVAPADGTLATGSSILGPGKPEKPASRTMTTQGSAMRFGSFIWLAAGMGALSLLTPCVFPMLPITVSYFTHHSGGSRKNAVFMASTYAVGIILTFTALGMLLAAAFGAGGVNQLAANPWINLLITAIFLGFGFSLFGAFLVQVPARLMNLMNSLTRADHGSEVIGVLLMGLTFTLTSFTCTSPFVGTLLVMTAQGTWHWPLAGMFVFSAVFALPFFLLALAPQLMSHLPKAGGWLNSIKVVMGFLEISAAMKFLSNADLVWHWGVFTRQVVLAVWVGIGVVIVLYVFGSFRLPHDEGVESVSTLRLAVAIVFLSGTIWLVPGLFGRQLGELESFLPPMDTGASSATSSTTSGKSDDAVWIMNDYEGALAAAKQQDKPVFIDFTGYTCTNCRWMEANLFPRAEVARELQRYVRVRLYTDGVGERFERQQKLQQEKFGTVALPLYAIVRPDGAVVATFSGLTRNASEFLAFLRKGSAFYTCRAESPHTAPSMTRPER